MLLTEHLAVIIPPGRKLPSSWEQGSSACELTGVSRKRKAGGQADIMTNWMKAQKKNMQFNSNLLVVV